MDWTNEKVLKFLELYRNHRCIWDPKHGSHKNKRKLNAAWIDIQNNMEEPCTVMELKKKKESLMSAYRGYKTKIMRSAITSEVYKPTWFAYEFMNSFLDDIYKCNASMNPKDNYNDDDEDDNDNFNTGQDDAELNTIEIESTSPEEKYIIVSRSSNDMYMNEDSSSLKDSASTSKRKQNKSHLKKERDESFSNLELKDDEDECAIFGKLVAAKMRRLAGSRRDLMMIKISQLFYDEHKKTNRHSSESSEVSPGREEKFFNDVSAEYLKLEVDTEPPE